MCVYSISRASLPPQEKQWRLKQVQRAGADPSRSEARLPREQCRACPDDPRPSTLHWREGGKRGAPPPLWETAPLAVGSSARTPVGCGAQGLPGCPQAPGGERSNRGTGNEINSLSKLLISGEEERILQLRQGCFIYILGTKNDGC